MRCARQIRLRRRQEQARGLARVRCRGGLGYHGTFRRLAISAASEAGRRDIEFEARMYLHQTELQFGLGQPRRSWDELEQLIDDPAVALPSWLVAFTHGFFAAWDDEAAEER